MTKEFVLQGLCCASCAAKIEREVSKLEGVIAASINLATAKLRIETSLVETSLAKTSLIKNSLNDLDTAPKNAPGNSIYGDISRTEIENIVHTYEPDVLVLEEPKRRQINPAGNSSKLSLFLKILWLSTGAITFAAGMLLEFAINLANLSNYITLFLFAVSYLLLGGKIILRMIKNIFNGSILKGQIFDENFLMGVATLGAIAIDKLPEAVAVMLFYQVGEFFQQMAVAKSKKRIGNLMDIRPDYANLKKMGQITKVHPEEVQVNDIFVVKPGEKIPLDGIVEEGEALLDTTALTGESVPKKVSVGDICLSGCINQNGLLTIKTTKTFGESTVSKILDLVENAADKKAPTETFITKFARYYTPTVVGLAVLLAIIPPLFFGGMWSGWIYRSLIFLIISCPCALVLSIPMGFFGGIGSASKKGILVKGGNYLEAMAKLDLVVFDKTGTLTKGQFKVTDVEPVDGFTKDDLLEYAAYAESFSNHPIALSIMKEYGKEISGKSSLSEYQEIVGYGISVKVNGREVLAGNDKLMRERKIEKLLDDKIIEDASNPRGDFKINSEINSKVNSKVNSKIGTKIYIAVDGTYAGSITVSDEIKQDSKKAIASLKELGVRKTVMLTGDIPKIAQDVANELNLDEVHASLLPHQKVEKVEKLIKEKQPKKTLAFVGDGINDAPVLAMADVGVAMGAMGSDAAIEAADVVLMTDEPGKLVEAVKIARFTRRVVWQNIVLALGTQILFLFLATVGVASIWEAVFADVGVSLLAVFNSMRIMQK